MQVFREVKVRKERVFYLDFVRVIAFLLIIIFHFNISVGVRNLGNITILVNDFANGNLAHIGVPLFFIISGIALSITIKDGSFKCFEFYKKRFFSIYPMFWLGYALVL